MYSRYTPLWSNVYHMFQTSSHGKYRFQDDRARQYETVSWRGNDEDSNKVADFINDCRNDVDRITADNISEKTDLSVEVVKEMLKELYNINDGMESDDTFKQQKEKIDEILKEEEKTTLFTCPSCNATTYTEEGLEQHQLVCPKRPKNTKTITTKRKPESRGKPPATSTTLSLVTQQVAHPGSLTYVTPRIALVKKVNHAANDPPYELIILPRNKLSGNQVISHSLYLNPKVTAGDRPSDKDVQLNKDTGYLNNAGTPLRLTSPDNTLDSMSNEVMETEWDGSVFRDENGVLLQEYTLHAWRKNQMFPTDAQMAILQVDHNKCKNILIAHQPGEGKTVNAVLLAEMRRNIYLKMNGNGPMNILVVTPNPQILLQWQETVQKWGFDPHHWIFQTEAHFRRSQSANVYPREEDLNDETKKIYDDIWKNPSIPSMPDDTTLDAYFNTTDVTLPIGNYKRADKSLTIEEKSFQAIGTVKALKDYVFDCKVGCLLKINDISSSKTDVREAFGELDYVRWNGKPVSHYLHSTIQMEENKYIHTNDLEKYENDEKDASKLTMKLKSNQDAIPTYDANGVENGEIEKWALEEKIKERATKLKDQDRNQR